MTPHDSGEEYVVSELIQLLYSWWVEQTALLFYMRSWASWVSAKK
jgi:hypothetical protein